ATPPPAAAPAPAVASAPTVAPAPAALPAAAPAIAGTPTAAAPPPPPRSLAEAVQQQVARFDPCTRARDRWREAAASLTERTSALERCLDGQTYRCRGEAGAVAPALATLEWAEQQVEDACR